MTSVAWRLVICVSLLAAPGGALTAQWNCWNEQRTTLLVRFDDELRVSGRILDAGAPDRPRGEGTDPGRGIAIGQLLEVTWVDHVNELGVIPTDSIVLVRWVPGPDCALIPDPVPLPDGSEQVVEGRIRDREDWIDTRLTIDATPEHVWAMPGPIYGAALGDAYREFLLTLPTEAEWNGDCRRVFPRIEAWLAENEQWTSRGPFNNLHPLRKGCNAVLERLIRARIRLPEFATKPSPALQAWHDAECVGDQPVAIDGQFTGSDLDQSALMCQGHGVWRLVVLTFSDPVNVTELVRMPGEADDWLLSVGPPDYFRWMESVEHRFDDGPPDPMLDIIILDETDQTKDHVIGRVAPTIAFFRLDRRWSMSSSRCCYWGQQQMPTRPPH